MMALPAVEASSFTSLQDDHPSFDGGALVAVSASSPGSGSDSGDFNLTGEIQGRLEESGVFGNGVAMDGGAGGIVAPSSTPPVAVPNTASPSTAPLGEWFYDSPPPAAPSHAMRPPSSAAPWTREPRYAVLASPFKSNEYRANLDLR